MKVTPETLTDDDVRSWAAGLTRAQRRQARDLIDMATRPDGQRVVQSWHYARPIICDAINARAVKP